MKDTKSSQDRAQTLSIVCPIDRSQRFEDFLSSLGISKSWMKSYLNVRQLKINNQTHFELPIDVLMKNHINPEYLGPKIEILHEDSEFIVLDKPARVHSHPLRYDEKNNCLSFLRSLSKGNSLFVNEKSYDRGLLFRLDYETSGVLIYCKDHNLRTDLFGNRLDAITLKRYTAIVAGDYNYGEKVSIPLKPSGKKGRKMIFNKGGDLGEMTVEKVRYNSEKKLSLLNINLKTGLRHQIRAQLSYLGHPILGDELYGGDKSDRMYLHSTLYEINFNNIKFKIESNPQSFLVHFLTGTS